jgi:hypothetical protein
LSDVNTQVRGTNGSLRKGEFRVPMKPSSQRVGMLSCWLKVLTDYKEVCLLGMLRKGALIPSFQDRDNPRNICLPDKETVP